MSPRRTAVARFTLGSDGRLSGTGNRWYIVIAILVTTFLSAMEVTVVGTSLPTIAGALGGVALFSWVFTAYLVTSTITTPIYGKLADLFGRKRTLLAGVSLFLFGSVLCGFAPSMPLLVLFRLVQGLGAGAILPVTMTIFGDLFSIEERARFQGILAGVWGFSALVGPAVGVAVIATLGWRWVFWINVPVGLGAAALLVAFLKEKVPAHRPRLDWAGAGLLVGATTSLLLALALGGTFRPWSDPVVLGLLGAAGLMAVQLVRTERTAPEPLLPLELFKVPIIRWSMLANICFGVALMASAVYVPLFAQGALGAGVRSTGLVVGALSLGWPVASTLGARLLLVWGFRRMAVVGQTVQLLAVVGWALLGPRAPLWQAMALVGALGAGFGLANSAYLIGVQNAVDWRRRGVATSTLTFIRALGQSTGGALLGTLLNVQLAARLDLVTGLPATAAGEGRLGAAGVLLDPLQAAELAPAVLGQMRLALHSSIQVVLTVVTLFAVFGLLFALRMPGGLPGAGPAAAPGPAAPAGNH